VETGRRRAPNQELWELGALNDKDALLSAVESIVGLGTWVWDVRQARVAWSDGLYRIFGYEPGAISASVESFFAAVHPDDREMMARLSRAGVERGETPTVYSRIVRPDGEVRHVRVDGIAVFEEGAVSRLVGTILDMTEQISRERQVARTAAFLNQAQRIGHIGSWHWDPSDGSMQWSEELYRIFGVSPDVTPTEELFFSLVHPDDREAARRGSWVVIGQDPSRREFRIVTPEGKERWVVIESRMSEEQGSTSALIGTVLDITERKRLEDELRHAQKMEAVGRLAGGIAHDFNNLLAIIQGSAELVQRRVQAPEIDDILQAADRGAALTRRLLAFSRRAVVRAKVLDLNDVVMDAARLVRRVIGEDIRIRLELSGELGAVYADPAQLEQVVMNLVLNARDAMPEGGVLTIRTANVPPAPTGDEGELVLLSVTDTGVGMDEATRARVFEPFFTTKPVGQGTGLGLSTVFGIVTQSGGRVQVESQPNQGSTFSVFLPRVPKQSESPESRSLQPPLTGNERILLVEDDDRVRPVITRMLESAGYRVVTAEHAQRALSVAEAASEPFDLLLTDVVMPGMSGHELARRLFASGRVRSLLYMTGHAPGDDESEAPDATQIFKPFSERDLLSRVRLALESRR
jgi:two-component system cell cycle sensor histidine kinase/response regulator CckA